MRVLVCGGRGYHDVPFLERCLTALHAKHGVTLIVTGSATGADLHAESWARHNAIPYYGLPADWDRHGKSAGYIRNDAMLKLPDVIRPETVVAFPGGRGTAMMVELSKKAGLQVWEPRKK